MTVAIRSRIRYTGIPMLKIFLFFLALHGLTATIAFAEDSTCLMADRQQQNLILTEGPKALKSETTSECFKSILKDEMTLLKEGDSPIANDSVSAIHSLMHAALERDGFDKTQAE
jgi:hypothetical protein